MQVKLFDKEGEISTSAVFFAYNILKIFEHRKKTRLTMFKLLKDFRQTNPNADSKQLFYGLIFLRMSGKIDIDDTYINLKGTSNA